MSVLSGRDTLGLMPTGGGKSITFRGPGYGVARTYGCGDAVDLADERSGRQSQKAEGKGGVPSFRYDGERIQDRKRNLLTGERKLLYVSPERLRNQRFIQELRMTEVSLIVVDEAHCIHSGDMISVRHI